MGSFQQDAPFQASHASFKRGARVADDDDDEEEDKIPADDLGAARAAPFGRRSRAGSSVTDMSSNASINYGKSARQDRFGSDSFWCGAFCMHLPGLSRRRPIMQQQQSMSLSEPDAPASTAGPDEPTRSGAVSKAASMERFGHSSSSSGMVFGGRVDAEEDDQEVSAYFDLPLELLRSSSVDMESPVTAAFVFDSSRGRGKSMLPDLDFSFPAPPAFSSPSPSSRRA
ncbi:uncharacterized protein [Aegilops tauschii subsp. strangulata]|uniref:Uncharacterized protein n=2 Tax=Triticinae TaxID=1648030 RepID=A0A453FQJ8_AEGTS|nr:uncharacterized protein LOC109779827 [Aegilops tauschii subsp. strangulata]XP_044358142.1 uncharacterized protein LOC123079438 [Triticum aestivum]